MQFHVIAGNITADAEVRQSFLSFTLAENTKKQDGTETTKYHRVMYKTTDPEAVKPIFTKGRSAVAFAYDYSSRAYVSEKDKAAHADTTFWASRVQLMGAKPDATTIAQPASQTAQQAATIINAFTPTEEADPLPF